MENAIGFRKQARDHRSGMVFCSSQAPQAPRWEPAPDTRGIRKIANAPGNARTGLVLGIIAFGLPLLTALLVVMINSHMQWNEMSEGDALGTAAFIWLGCAVVWLATLVIAILAVVFSSQAVSHTTDRAVKKRATGGLVLGILSLAVYVLGPILWLAGVLLRAH